MDHLPAATTAATAGPARYRFGPFCLNVPTRELFHGNTVVPTPPKVFDLLLLLVSRHPQVVTKQQMHAQVWPRRVVTDAALNQAVLQARKLLARHAPQPHWIVSVPRVGYRFAEAVVADLADSAAAAAAPALAAATALYRQAFERWVKADADGLRLSIAALRQPMAAGGQALCRLQALLFECVLHRQAGQMQDAWAKLETAELGHTQAGLEGAAVLLTTCRGLMLFQFVSPAESIAEFAAAWDLAQRQGAPFEQALCAYHLASAFGRVGREADYVEWADTALRLAAASDMPWLWGSLACSLAGTCISLGEAAADAGQPEHAGRLWRRAAEMLEQSGAADGADPGSRLARVARINLTLVRGYLDPAQRPLTVTIFNQALADESFPMLRLALLLGLAVTLLRENCLDEAMDHCRAGIDLAEATGINRHHAALVETAAEICLARGDATQAVVYLKRLLRWREQRGRSEAEQAAAMTSIRLRTARALARAEAEGARARDLNLANQQLRRQLDLAGGEPGPAG